MSMQFPIFQTTDELLTVILVMVAFSPVGTAL